MNIDDRQIGEDVTALAAGETAGDQVDVVVSFAVAELERLEQAGAVSNRSIAEVARDAIAAYLQVFFGQSVITRASVEFVAIEPPEVASGQAAEAERVGTSLLTAST